MVVLAFFAVAFFLLIIVLVLVWVGASVWAISKALRAERVEAQEVNVPVSSPGLVDEPEEVTSKVVLTKAPATRSGRRN